ncbi:hypothetical protein J5N97_018147 [Dioscorea zingiberensis]|uniref:Uncharacterized protein n=1 Tax=Dioscorea zingiberensis TaxID=325984 RepID=A0A9D5CPN4_9LILI|nr:hypothetical protein J5N97_018147 [Dioscorea zingiberensis]
MALVEEAICRHILDESAVSPWISLHTVLSPEMSLATVKAYIWKKPEDLVLNYRVVQTR